MAARKPVIPLIIEPHPEDYIGYPFMTLIQYRKAPLLVIVDNATSEYINAFVLDVCGPEGVNEDEVISTAIEWYKSNSKLFPISIEFSRAGMTKDTSKLYRSLNVEFISRVIGPVPLYEMLDVKSIKRRRRKPIPANQTVLRVPTLIDEVDQPEDFQ